MPDVGHIAVGYGYLHDVGYVAAGYALTLATLAGYRWHLAVRTRRARGYVTAVTGRARAWRHRP